MGEELERRDLTETTHGFPGGPPHPPYGEPLPPGESAQPQEETPAKPPVKRVFTVTDKRKRKGRAKSKEKEKPKEKSRLRSLLAQPSRSGLSKGNLIAIVLIVAIAVGLQRCGEPPADRRGLGAEGAFAVIPAAFCRDSFEATLDPEKEIPLAAAPTQDTPVVSGKGLGEVLWAVSLESIVSPQTLSSRLTTGAGNVLSFARSDVALFYRTLTVQGPDTNHFTAIYPKTGDIAWQEVFSGWVLSVSSGHLWMAATVGEDSSVVAAIDAESGEIVRCFGGHAGEEDDQPPLFLAGDDQVNLAYDASGAAIGDDILVHLSADGGSVQRLAVEGEPERLLIWDNFYRVLSVAGDTVLVDAFDALEGRKLEDLDLRWTSSESVENTLSDSVAVPELALVHLSDYDSSTPDRRTLGLDPDTGEEIWRVLHPEEGSLDFGGLHASSFGGAITITDFTPEGTHTVVKTATVEREMKQAYLSFAAEQIVGLIREPLEGEESLATLIDLEKPGEEVATVEKAVTILGATAEEVVVELDVDGVPWLVGISLASESESEGGGGGGGDSEEEEQQQGGGGGGGQNESGDGEGAPDV